MWIVLIRHKGTRQAKSRVKLIYYWWIIAKNQKMKKIMKFFFWMRILSIFNTQKKIYNIQKILQKKSFYIALVVRHWYLSLCQIQNHYFNLLIFWVCEYVILVCHMCTVHASLFLFLVNWEIFFLVVNIRDIFAYRAWTQLVSIINSYPSNPILCLKLLF